jgi:hypothetical protein
MIDDNASDLRQRVLEERDKQAQRYNVLSRLLSATNQYLFQLRLPKGYCLEPVTVPATLARGETPLQAIGKLRIELFQVQQELAKVRAAPLPVQERLKAVEDYIVRRSLVGMPRIGIQRDQLVATWQDDIVTSKSDVFAILCALFPKSMSDALRREIEAQPAPVGAVPSADRIKRVAELEAHVLALEYKESALLTDEILPRPEMSPQGFLQVQIVAKEEAAAA